MMGVVRKAVCVLVAISVGVVLASIADAETFPYFNDFSAAGLSNENLDEHWTHDAENGTFDFKLESAVGNVTSTSSVEITDIGSDDFVMSTRFTLVNEVHLALTTSTIGFGAFGSSNTFLGSPNSYYLVDWFVNPTATNGGTLRISAQGDSAGFSAVNGDSDGEVNGDSIVVGNTYELRFTGIHNGGSLDMTFELLDSNGSPLGIAATATDTSPLAGTFFGYRNRVITTFSLDLAFDNFSVQAPDQSLIGDHNADGVVDAADYVAWRKTDGAPTGYDEWTAHFGESNGGGSSSTGAVPEPAGGCSLLLAIGVAATSRQRRIIHVLRHNGRHANVVGSSVSPVTAARSTPRAASRPKRNSMS